MHQKTRRPKDGEYQDVSEIDEYEYEFLHFSWLFYVQRITKLGKSIDKNCISVNFLFTQPRKNCITIKKCVYINNFCVYT